MIVTGLDLETTGLDVEKGHRIIELAMVKMDVATKSVLDKLILRIDPERPIDAKAQEVHGISYEELVGCPKWEDIAPQVVSFLDDTDWLVAHNVSFDAPFIATELRRVGLTEPNLNVFCTMENARWACPDGKLPKLGELCFALNIPYDPSAAHSAEYDILVTMDCLFEGIKRGFYTLEEEATV